jgi:hypothetical protein
MKNKNVINFFRSNYVTIENNIIPQIVSSLYNSVIANYVVDNDITFYCMQFIIPLLHTTLIVIYFSVSPN